MASMWYGKRLNEENTKDSYQKMKDHNSQMFYLENIVSIPKQVFANCFEFDESVLELVDF